MKKIEREKEANIVHNIIKNSEIYSKQLSKCLSLCINAEWGEGKTTFINQLSDKYLDANYNTYFFIFDSYKYDYFDTPLESLFKFLADSFSSKTSSGNAREIIIRGLFNIATSIISKIPFVGHGLSKTIDEYDQKVKNENDSVETFKQELKKFIKDKKMVICIDELDRCKPKYAIELIEICKHIFDIENVVIIYSTNLKVLNQSIEHYYGLGANNSEEYTYRIFDRVINLSLLKNEQIIHLYFSSCGNMSIVESAILWAIQESQLRFTPRKLIRFLDTVFSICAKILKVNSSETCGENCFEAVLSIVFSVLIEEENLKHDFFNKYNNINSILEHVINGRKRTINMYTIFCTLKVFYEDNIKSFNDIKNFVLDNNTNSKIPWLPQGVSDAIYNIFGKLRFIFDEDLNNTPEKLVKIEDIRMIMRIYDNKPENTEVKNE